MENTEFSELVNRVSQQTQHSPECVEEFITQLFSQIEQELLTSSKMQVKGLGIFRIISSTDIEKILFLGNFEEKVSDTQKKEEISPPSDEKIVSVEKETKFTEKEADRMRLPPKPTIFRPTVADKKQEDNVIPEKQEQHEEENITEASQIPLSTRNKNDLDFQEDTEDSPDLFATTEKRRNKWKKIASFVLLSSFFCFLFFILFNQKSNNQKPHTTKETLVNCIEITNKDTSKYSHIVIPQIDISIVLLSEKYYGSGVFWAYIYNQDSLPKQMRQLVIPKGTVVKIPRIKPELIDTVNEESVSRAKELGNKILDNF